MADKQQGDLISRSRLLRDIYFQEGRYPETHLLRMAIREQPAVDAVEVKHGRWANPYINRYGHPCHCCSECGFKASYQDKNYCPNCGAKMDGGVDDAGRKQDL